MHDTIQSFQSSFLNPNFMSCFLEPHLDNILWLPLLCCQSKPIEWGTTPLICRAPRTKFIRFCHTCWYSSLFNICRSVPRTCPKFPYFWGVAPFSYLLHYHLPSDGICSRCHTLHLVPMPLPDKNFGELIPVLIILFLSPLKVWVPISVFLLFQFPTFTPHPSEISFLLLLFLRLWLKCFYLSHFLFPTCNYREVIKWFHHYLSHLVPVNLLF